MSALGAKVSEITLKISMVLSQVVNFMVYEWPINEYYTSKYIIYGR